MRRSLLFASTLLLTPVMAEGQEAAAQLWSRLENVLSLEELPAVSAPPGVHPDIANALIRVKEFELGHDRTDGLVAIFDLRRLEEREPSASVYFALGVALARGPGVRVPPGRHRPSYFADEYSNGSKQAPRALRRALELDPQLHEAAWVLADLALDLGDRPLMGEALELLGQPSRSALPETQLLRAKMLSHLEEFRGAAAAADSARRVGADAAVALHEKAAALLRLSDGAAEGARAYFEGIDSLTVTGARAYWEAVAQAMSPGEKLRFNEADLEGKRDVLRRFWQVHAALAGVPVSQRLAEHFRRVAVVTRDGRVARMGGGGAAGRIADVRGYGISNPAELLMLRHGDPILNMRIFACGPDVLDVPPPLRPTPRECGRSREGRARLFKAPSLDKLLYRSMTFAVEGNSWYPPLKKHLVAVHEVLQFRGAGGQTVVVASVALPAESARELVTDGVLRADLSLAVVDTATASVVHQQETRSFRLSSLPEDGWVLLATELAMQPLPAQQYRISVMDTEREKGRVVGGELDIRRFPADSLLVSDVLVTPQDGAPSFRRGDVRLSLAPGRLFQRDESLTLYYEVYGIAAEDAYRTEISIRRQPEGFREQMRALFGDAPEAVRLAFDEVAPAAHVVYGVQQTRSVGLNGLLPGDYDLTIVVTDARGRVAMRTRTLMVLE